MASEKILTKKKEEVKKLSDEMKEAKLILLTNYRGINVTDDTTLRRDLRNANARYTIIKNNITKRALAECGIEGLEDILVGPTAVVICDEDYLAPSKVIYNFSKDNDYYEIKGGVIDGKVMTPDEIITLAKLPSREELLSMLAGALLGNISKFAVALEEVRKQKEQTEGKPAASEPVKEEVKEEKAEAEVKAEAEAKTEEPAKEEVKEEKAEDKTEEKPEA